MRMMLKAKIGTQAASRAIQDGTMPGLMQEAIGGLQPEAAYFTAEEGKRCCYIVFDMQGPSDLPRITEPFFQNVNAEIEVKPVMNLEDLQAGLGRLGGGRAVRRAI